MFLCFLFQDAWLTHLFIFTGRQYPLVNCTPSTFQRYQPRIRYSFPHFLNLEFTKLNFLLFLLVSNLNNIVLMSDLFHSLPQVLVEDPILLQIVIL